MVRRHRIRLWGSYRKVRDCVANTIGDGEARFAGDAESGRARRAMRWNIQRRGGGGLTLVVVLFYFIFGVIRSYVYAGETCDV